MRPLTLVVLAAVAAPAGLASQDTTASPRDWWGGDDSNRVAFVTAHGQPQRYSQLVMWAPSDSLDPRWLAAFGDTLDKGIGCITDARVQDFYEKMVKAGVTKPGLDLSKVYTTKFQEI